jgi:hypothetical protein
MLTNLPRIAASIPKALSRCLIIGSYHGSCSGCLRACFSRQHVLNASSLHIRYGNSEPNVSIWPRGAPKTHCRFLGHERRRRESLRDQIDPGTRGSSVGDDLSLVA